VDAKRSSHPPCFFLRQPWAPFRHERITGSCRRYRVDPNLGRSMAPTPSACKQVLKTLVVERIQFNRRGGVRCAFSAAVGGWEPETSPSSTSLLRYKTFASRCPTRHLHPPGKSEADLRGVSAGRLAGPSRKYGAPPGGWPSPLACNPAWAGNSSAKHHPARAVCYALPAAEITAPTGGEAAVSASSQNTALRRRWQRDAGALPIDQIPDDRLRSRTGKTRCS